MALPAWLTINAIYDFMSKQEVAWYFDDEAQSVESSSLTGDKLDMVLREVQAMIDEEIRPVLNQLLATGWYDDLESVNQPDVTGWLTRIGKQLARERIAGHRLNEMPANYLSGAKDAREELKWARNKMTREKVPFTIPGLEDRYIETRASFADINYSHGDPIVVMPGEW